MELNLSNRGLFSFDGSVLTEETSLLANADTTAKSTQDIVKHRKSSNKQKKGNALIPKIAKINLSHNNLHLFTGGERLRTVTHLFLSHNELTSLYTSTLPPLLVVLDLSYNKLEEVSRLGATAAQLEVLDLSHNALTTDGIGQLPQAQLLQLNLSYNAIDSLEPIAGATRLTELNASFNVIGEGLFDKEDSYITYTSEEENETYASHYDKKKEQRGEKLMEHESVVGSLAALAQLPNLKKLDLRGNPLFSEPDDDRHHNHNNSSVNGDIIDTANQFILNNCKRLTMLNKVALSQSNQNQMYKARREHENSQTSRLLPHNTLQKNNNRSHIQTNTSINNYNSQLSNSKVYSFRRSQSSPASNIDNSTSSNNNSTALYRRTNSTASKRSPPNRNRSANRSTLSNHHEKENSMSLPLQLIHTRVVELRRLWGEQQKKEQTLQQKQSLLLEQIHQLSQLSKEQEGTLMELLKSVEEMEVEQQTLTRAQAEVDREYESVHAVVVARRVAAGKDLERKKIKK